jgi:hypothetical protein
MQPSSGWSLASRSTHSRSSDCFRLERLPGVACITGMRHLSTARTDQRRCRIQFPPISAARYRIRYYFNAVETLVKVAFSIVPMLLTATTITIDMPPAISAYSMAVAPESSLRKRPISLHMM